MANKIRTIPEPNKTLDVVGECDIVVVDGGPGGIGAEGSHLFFRPARSRQRGAVASVADQFQRRAGLGFGRRRLSSERSAGGLLPADVIAHGGRRDDGSG